MKSFCGFLAVLALTGGLAVASAAQAATAVEESNSFLEDARGHIEGGDLRAAVIDLKNALQQNPENAEARLLLGSLYVDLGQPQEAEKELKEAQRLGVPYERVAIGLGRAMLLQGRFQGLLSELDATRLPDEQAFDVLMLRAQAQAGLGRNEEAIDSLELANKMNPTDGRALVTLGRLYAALGRYDRAEEKAAGALAADPGLRDALLLSGDLKRQRGDPEGSLEDYGRVLEEEPGNVSAALGRAASLLVLARDAEAAADVETVLAEAPQNPMARYLNAHIKLRAGDVDAAADIMGEIGTALDRFPPAHWLSGIIEYAQGQYETARVWLDRYIVTAPENVEARKLLGATLIRLNAPDDAVEVLQPARELAPEDGQIMALLGGAYLRAGRNAEAVEQLEAAAAQAPDNPGLLSSLALSLLASGETAAAKARFDSALDLGLEDSAVGHLIAMSHLNAGRFDEALTVARELKTRFPDSPLPHNLEGAAHVGAENWEAAREAIEAALQIDPELLSARLNLAALDARQGQLDRAELAYLAVLEDDESNVTALSALADIARLQGKTADALAWRKQAYELDITALAPGLAYVQALRQAGELDEAMAVVQRMRASNPDQPQLLSALATLQASKGRHDEAIANFARLGEVTDGDPGVRMRLAQAHLDAGDAAQARKEIEKLVLDEPAYGPASIALTRLVLEAEGNEAALARARGFAEANPDQAWGLQLVGDLLLQDGRSAEAVEAFERAWAMEQSSGLAIGLYRARSIAGRGEAALEPLRQRLAAEPNDQPVREALAGALIGRGKSDEARVLYEALVEAGSGNATVWNNLAWIYFEDGDERALAYAEQALLLAPDQPAIMDTLAWIQLQQGETSQALRLLERADAAAPDEPEIGYHYAVALHRSGRDDEAETVLRRVLGSDRPFPSASDARALLDEISGN